VFEFFSLSLSQRPKHNISHFLIQCLVNDLELGGETVFPAAPSPFVGDDVSPALAIRQLRESGELDMVEQGSWEEQMIGTCQTRLVTRPRSSRAVLFYSQYPNGQKDLSSKHGGCPTIKGTKWAANLWVSRLLGRFCYNL
jgi:prolyl 4-hydroxylase